MTDETYEQLRAHCQRHSISPGALFPDGRGLDLVVVDGEHVVELEPSRVLLSRDEYADLQRRAARLPWPG